MKKNLDVECCLIEKSGKQERLSRLEKRERLEKKRNKKRQYETTNKWER
jgi:hypothetical protein